MAFATALALVAIAVVPGMASATFSAPVDLSAPLRDANRPQVAVGADGATTITWQRSNGDNTIIQARTRPAGSGDFGGVVNLSASGRNAANPQVAVGGPDGATTITWARWNGDNTIIQARTRPAGQTDFGGVVDLSEDGQDAGFPQVAVGPDGTTVIMWRRSGGANNYIIQARTRPAGQTDFGGVVDLSAVVQGQQAFTPQVAVGPGGATTITWMFSTGFTEIIQARTRRAGQPNFDAIVDLTGPAAYDPQVAVGPDGATTITWRRYDPSSIIQARTRPAEGGDFGGPVNLSENGQDAVNPQVAVGADGATTITWSRGSIIQARTRPAEGGAFGGVVNLSASGQNAEYPQIAVGADGATAITWQRSNDDNTIIQARTRPAEGGDFGDVVNLSEDGQDAVNPQVAVGGPDGATTITWSRWNGDNSIIQTSSGEATLARLSVTTDGSGAGSVTSAPAGINCGATCGAYFAIGSSVTLTATAAGGSSFTGWSGSGCSGTSTCTVTMSEARAVTAEFAVVPPGQFDLMVSKSGTGAGTVTSSPAGINCGSDCSETLPSGTSVTLTAAPAADSTFTGWSGSGCSGTSTCTVVMSEARAVTAQFTKLPSNVFPTPKLKAGASALSSSVRVPGRGTITQRVTRSSNLAAVLTVCKASGKATKAGWVKLTCKLSAATRKALRQRSLRVSVKTTFTPTGGLPASKTQAVTLKSQRPPPYTG